MKIVRTIFYSLLALILVLCTAVFIFFQTFNTDQYLTLITDKASLALGRPVSIGGLGLGITWGQITLDAGPLIVGDDKDFTTQPFIKIDKVRLTLDLMSLAFQRKIQITRIILQSPQIHFIRSLEGKFNFQGIDRLNRLNVIPNNNVIPAKVEDPVKAVARIQNDNRGQLPINILIQDASISYIDQNQTFPLDIWLKSINANLNNVSLLKPFQLSFEASPLVLKGISLGDPDSPVFKNIAGVVQLNMSHFVTGGPGDLVANGDIIITGGVIKNFNIINTVLSHTLGAFSGMEIKSKLGSADTFIKRAEVKFSLHDKNVYIDDSLIETDILEFRARGLVDQSLNTDLETSLSLNTVVSAALVNDLKGLRYFNDESNRITINASIKGVAPHLKFKPDKDFRKKSKKALMEEGGNILGVLLGGGQISAPDQDASSQDSGKKAKKSFKNIFKSLLQ